MTLAGLTLTSMLITTTRAAKSTSRLSRPRHQRRRRAEQSNTVTAFNKYFDREVTFQRPDEVSFTFFQQDMNSHEMSQTEKMGAMGDYIRTLMPEAEYREFRRRSIEDARRLGDKAAAHFYRVMNYMLEFSRHIVESDEQALKKETSRAERRAAEKARRRQAKKK